MLFAETRRIEQLPASTRSKLRSTQILTSLPQVISELVQNSLDAGAKNVEIGVDCQDWSCWVKDNGSGINKEDLAFLSRGSEDERYMSSKVYDPHSLETQAFGFRGEALASTAELCCLEITSRTSRSRESWSIILKGSKTLYHGPATRWRRESPGTTVYVRDAFFNLPVRRLSHATPSRTIELIRQDVSAHALVFPGVSFSLETTNESRDKRQVLRVPKTASSLTAFRQIYGRALVENVDEIDVTSGTMTLSGFISLEGAHSKSHQYLYVNRHLLAVSDLHRVVDNMFTSSSFGRNALDDTGDRELPRSTVRRSPRKTERRPIYVLNLTIPPHEVDNHLEPNKSAVQFQDSNGVSAFLASTVRQFLVRNRFMYANAERVEHVLSGSPRKRRKILTSDQGVTETLAFLQTTHNKNLAPALYAELLQDDEPESENREIIWRDPATGEDFTVDKRTGNSYRHGKKPAENNDQGTGEEGSGQTRRTLGILKDKNDKREPLEWIKKALLANHVYALSEPKIPSLSIPIPDTHNCGAQNRIDMNKFFTRGQSRSFRSFQNEDLYDAQVISQVDRKFIACFFANGEKDRGSSGSTLVLIDQHAADERIRVEKFLKGLCMGFVQHDKEGAGGIDVKELKPPIPILLTRQEVLTLKDSAGVRDAFASWGICFEKLEDIDSSPPSTGDSGYEQVVVSSIPDLVSDKLLMGNELRELLKGFLAVLEDSSHASSLVQAQKRLQSEWSTSGDGLFWLKALPWLPKELLDLVNSKACRGAIMFNDSLDLEQCRRLVNQLSQTAFPFQCAHGRPSLVPLTDIRDLRRKPKTDWSTYS